MTLAIKPPKPHTQTVQRKLITSNPSSTGNEPADLRCVRAWFSVPEEEAIAALSNHAWHIL